MFLQHDDLQKNLDGLEALGKALLHDFLWVGRRHTDGTCQLHNLQKHHARLAEDDLAILFKPVIRADSPGDLHRVARGVHLSAPGSWL
jgi:hypothetical protein